MIDQTAPQKLLSDIVVYNKYSKFDKRKSRRETWGELVTRNKNMHLEKFPELKEEIDNAYRFVYDKKILPSMRSLQFAGKPIAINNSRIFNCAYLPIDDWRAFNEVMFLLLSGCGVGFSVQTHHIEKLPEITKPTKSRRYLIGDSIEGWADAIRVLVKAYLGGGKWIPQFDFRDIREKGAALITSGGKAPGPEPLKECLFQVQKILDRKKDGEYLTSLEIDDIICHIADAVLSGGIRRAALIALFDLDDEDMLTCKFGNWWEENPQRGRANNSAVIVRSKVKEEDFFKLWGKIVASNSGEPGIYFTNDKDWGTNPSLRGGTKVITKNGIFNIEDLQNKEFIVKNLNGEESKATCWLSGTKKQLYEITLKGNHKYWCTPEHKWPVLENKVWKKITTDKIEKGMFFPTLPQNKLFDGSLGTYDDGLMLGWCLGDGNLSVSNEGRKQIGFVFSKEDQELGISNKIISYLNSIGGTDIKGYNHKLGTLEIQTTNSKIISHFEKFGFNHKSEGLPGKVWEGGTEEFRKGIISGLISSDGCISEFKSKRITFSSSHGKLIKDVSELLGFYGVKTSIYENITEGNFPNKKYNGKLYKGYSLVINDNSSIRHFKNIFHIEHSLKNQKLEILINSLKKINNKNTGSLKVIDIKLSEIYEDVWDINVQDETHCFQIPHVITGNCGEIALRPNQFCNLVEVNASNVESQEDLNERVLAAAFIGTLQASYTDFHYLRDIWRKTTERDALVGVGMTGIASGAVLGLDLKQAAKIAKTTNSRIAKLIGINAAARVTTIKPSGTSSLVLSTSSGIHAWWWKWFKRRMRIGKSEPLYKYMMETNPQLLEDDFFKPTIQAILTIPQKAPDNSIMRTESALELLERIKKFNIEWVKAGHRKGDNTNNVSATVSVKPEEWEQVGEWMWKNRDTFNGLAVLPYDNGSYVQAPNENITEEEYNLLVASINKIDLTKVVELDDNTDLQNELACSGPNGCEVM